ncbi:hypothetical protein N7497_012127 [Penicillium chrysogenum]|nr:hypothetical protein N7497_012127 [Penicillium chrysogenum]
MTTAVVSRLAAHVEGPLSLAMHFTRLCGLRMKSGYRDGAEPIYEGPAERACHPARCMTRGY